MNAPELKRMAESLLRGEVSIEEFAAYDFSLTRIGNQVTASVYNIANGFYGADPGTGLVISQTVTENMLGPGAVGIFQDNAIGGHWSMLMVPEPNTMALAGMGCLGIVVFFGLRQRRIALS